MPIESGLGSHKPSVLVIDDDEDLLAVVRLNLETDGFAVETASSGAEGLAMAVARPPDAIILDIMMPRVDGWMVLSELRSRPETSKIPVMVLTAKSEMEARSTAYRMLAQQFATKPFDARELGPMVRALVHASPESRADRPVARPEPLVTARAGDRTVLIPAHEIGFIRRAGRWSEVHCRRGVFPATTTMLELEQRLDSVGFIRVHRSFLVNGNEVRELLHKPEGTTFVALSFPEAPEIPVSRRKLGALARRLGISPRA